MKNVLKFGLALAVFFTVSGARANDNDFTLKVKEGMGKVISFTMEESADVTITIYSSNNVILFGEKLKGKDGEKTKRTYDLKALPEGTYSIETETSTKVTRHELVISGNNAVLTDKGVTDIYKPVITKKDGIVSLNILNTEQTPVQITMYDDNNSEIYNETVSGASRVTKNFDVSKLYNKKFTVVTTYSNKTFVDNITAR